MTTDQHVIKRNEAPPRLHPQKKKMKQVILLMINMQRVKILTDIVRVSFLWSKFIFPQ